MDWRRGLLRKLNIEGFNSDYRQWQVLSSPDSMQSQFYFLCHESRNFCDEYDLVFANPSTTPAPSAPPSHPLWIKSLISLDIPQRTSVTANNTSEQLKWYVIAAEFALKPKIVFPRQCNQFELNGEELRRGANWRVVATAWGRNASWIVTEIMCLKFRLWISTMVMIMLTSDEKK